MGADEAILLHGLFQLAHTAHSLGRIDPGDRAEAVGVPLDKGRDLLVWDLIVDGMLFAAGLGCDQQRTLDAGPVQFLKEVILGDPVQRFPVDADLATQELLAPSGAQRRELGRVRIDDCVNDAYSCVGHGYSPSAGRRSTSRSGFESVIGLKMSSGLTTSTTGRI